MKRKSKSWHNPRGTSILEMIIVLPVLLFLMFGIVELSRAWMTVNVVTQAAYEGARVAVVTSPWDGGSAAITRINAVLAGANIPNSTITIASQSVVCSSPCGTNSPVTASVTVNFHTLFPILLPMLSSLPITDTTVMRYE